MVFSPHNHPPCHPSLTGSLWLPIVDEISGYIFAFQSCELHSAVTDGISTSSDRESLQAPVSDCQFSPGRQRERRACFSSPGKLGERFSHYSLLPQPRYSFTMGRKSEYHNLMAKRMMIARQQRWNDAMKVALLIPSALTD